MQVFCKKVSDSYLWSLVTFLLEGLVDFQAHSSSGACVVLNNIVKLRGSTLSEQVTVVVIYVHVHDYTRYVCFYIMLLYTLPNESGLIFKLKTYIYVHTFYEVNMSANLQSSIII